METESLKNILVTCPKGGSEILEAEIASLGIRVEGRGSSWVRAGGGMADAMRLNLMLRTGVRVLMELGSFEARGAEDFYAGMKSLAWEAHIPADGYFSVHSSVHNDTINHTLFANLKAKDAIVDRIREKAGRRPDSGPESDRAVVFIHWHGTRASAFLDTSGNPLSSRGYRTSGFSAPLRENLAATLVISSGWKGDRPFVNPMCGSGTIAIEAALLAMGLAPGMLRESFAFMHLKGFSPKEWKRIKEDSLRDVKKAPSCGITASDASPAAISAARENAKKAGVEGAIRFEVCDFAKTTLPPEPGVMIFNPAYGKRIGDTEGLPGEYHRIGDFLKTRCQGWTGFIFTGNPELAKSVGLRASARKAFYNGNIECRLLRYELYGGTRRPDKPMDSTS